METMKAARLKDYDVFEIFEAQKPVISAHDDVLIRVLVCSICGTDASFSGKPDQPSEYGDMRGRILGHEIVGEVCETGDGVTSLKVGDRVVLNPNSYCDTCSSCRGGYRNHCENMELMGITTPGGFAEYVKSRERLVF